MEVARLRRWGQENHFTVNGHSRVPINILQFEFLLPISLPSESGFLSIQRQLTNPNFFLAFFFLLRIMKLQSCALVSINLLLSIFCCFSHSEIRGIFLFYSASSSIWDMISHTVDGGRKSIQLCTLFLTQFPSRNFHSKRRNFLEKWKFVFIVSNNLNFFPFSNLQVWFQVSFYASLICFLWTSRFTDLLSWSNLLLF